MKVYAQFLKNSLNLNKDIEESFENMRIPCKDCFDFNKNKPKSHFLEQN